MTLEGFAAIWIASVIGSTYLGDRAGKGVLGFLMGLFLGPLGLLITIGLSGGLNVMPDDKD